jgi:hypothetical protein
MNFRYREEISKYVALPVSTSVSHKFKTSFDAAAQDSILHFTASERTMNPLSILVPASLIEEAQAGWPVVLQSDRLFLGYYSLPVGTCICEVEPPEHNDYKLLHSNLSCIKRSLSLFGRQSSVSQTLLHLDRPETPLIEAVKMVDVGVVELTAFTAFIGSGEGLTPSFDDFLAGMLFIDRFYGYNRFVVSGSFFEMAAARTTRQALQQYRFAANGHFSRQFEQFTADLPLRKVENAELLSLLAWGHSSGTDTLCGIWYYLSRQVKINR